MKRKVIQMAGKTMVISLPHNWVKRFGIKKGDELDISEKNRKLEISIGKLSESKKLLALDFSDTPDVIIKHNIAILHKLGFDELHIKYQTEGQLKIIEETIDFMLLGYEVIDKSKNSCVVKSITKIDEEELTNIIRKNFFVILECSNAFLEIIKQNNYSQLSKILDYEKKNNTITNYSHRIINKSHEEQGGKLSYYYLILWELENVCDEFKHMANFLMKTNNKFRAYKEKDKWIIQINQMIESYYKLFYKLDTTSFNDFIKNCTNIQMGLEKELGTKLDRETCFFISSLLEITKNLKSLIGSTLALTFLNEK